MDPPVGPQGACRADASVTPNSRSSRVRPAPQSSASSDGARSTSAASESEGARVDGGASAGFCTKARHLVAVVLLWASGALFLLLEALPW
mmetsp:Transcript_12132/g.27654  ORF Transcript_12132/g.27654 Transcript_12132/m.27654 type:complete len:90 (-) Transcript_12132:1173-1442(-)